MNKIICGDALEELKKLPEIVDITITSPPYNLGNDHHTGNIKHNPYDDSLPEEEYQQQQIDVLNEIYRVTKQEGSLFYNHKNRIKDGKQITPYEWLLKTKWIIKQELVWFNGSQNFDKIRFYPMTERVYWLVKDTNTKLINTINAHDLFQWKAVGTSDTHTRAFPEKMVGDILKCFPDSKIVLDPYLGSGTTAIVAKKLDKEYIGIELLQRYCDIAEKRLNPPQKELF